MSSLHQRQQRDRADHQSDVPHRDVVPADDREYTEDVEDHEEYAELLDAADWGDSEDGKEDLGGARNLKPLVLREAEEAVHPLGQPTDPENGMDEFVQAEVGEDKRECRD